MLLQDPGEWSSGRHIPCWRRTPYPQRSVMIWRYRDTKIPKKWRIGMRTVNIFSISKFQEYYLLHSNFEILDGQFYLNKIMEKKFHHKNVAIDQCVFHPFCPSQKVICRALDPNRSIGRPGRSVDTKSPQLQIEGKPQAPNFGWYTLTLDRNFSILLVFFLLNHHPSSYNKGTGKSVYVQPQAGLLSYLRYRGSKLIFFRLASVRCHCSVPPKNLVPERARASKSIMSSC